jgi:hypothetical protein
LSLYATIEEFEEYMGAGWEGSDPIVLESTIRKAERDIDEYLGLAATETGYVYDPTQLDSLGKAALSRATCAQTEYRLVMGEPFFTGVTFGSEGPDVSTKKTPPRVAPYAKRELIRASLVQIAGRFV